jgi:hypothetical protein
MDSGMEIQEEEFTQAKFTDDGWYYRYNGRIIEIRDSKRSELLAQYETSPTLDESRKFGLQVVSDRPT